MVSTAFFVPLKEIQTVANYARNMEYEVGVIAHSCGVSNPRLLRRFHARMVMQNGQSIPLDELYPEPKEAGTPVTQAR